MWQLSEGHVLACHNEELSKGSVTNTIDITDLITGYIETVREKPPGYYLIICIYVPFSPSVWSTGVCVYPLLFEY